MFWTAKDDYLKDPSETESQLTSAIAEVSALLSGPNQIYLDVEKLTGGMDRMRNIPDSLSPEEIKTVEEAKH
jgi:hypothetical protein